MSSIFDAYIPTRTVDSLELRVRATGDRDLYCSLGSEEPEPLRPSIEHRAMLFYRRWFHDLGPGRRHAIRVLDGRTGRSIELGESTLARPPGRFRVRLGVCADLHLSGETGAIDDYAPGTRRLYGLAEELTRKYLWRMAELGASRIILPGDLLDPCTPELVDLAREIFSSVPVPVHAMIGNHEAWTPGGEQRFYRAFDLPEAGYTSFSIEGARVILLSTPGQNVLDEGSAQLLWLTGELEAAQRKGEDCFLFSHFSLLLHPCVQGWRNDGLQQLDNHQRVRRLLGNHSRVRAFIAGHKNVPSRREEKGVVHLLVPQLIQAPCGFDTLDIYEGGFVKSTYEIDEQHYAEVSRQAYATSWPQRFGARDDRNFTVSYGSRGPGIDAERKRVHP